MPPEGGTRRDGEERLDLALGPSGEDDGLEVATVPVPCAQGARLHAKWGPGHFLRLVDCLPEGATGGRGGATATSLRW